MRKRHSCGREHEVVNRSGTPPMCVRFAAQFSIHDEPQRKAMSFHVMSVAFPRFLQFFAVAGSVFV